MPHVVDITSQGVYGDSVTGASLRIAKSDQVQVGAISMLRRDTEPSEGSL